MNKREYITSQKESAKLLGLSLNEYYDSICHIKENKNFKENHKKQKNEMLKKLGLTEKDLKKRTC